MRWRPIEVWSGEERDTAGRAAEKELGVEAATACRALAEIEELILGSIAAGRLDRGEIDQSEHLAALMTQTRWALTATLLQTKEL
jgi:hypothetical protein